MTCKRLKETVVQLLICTAIFACLPYLIDGQRFPKCNMALANITENRTTSSDVIVDLNRICSDPNNRPLSYTILDGDNKTVFTVTATGAIKLTYNVNAERFPGPITLMVKVDNGLKSINTTIFIDIIYINDKVPTCMYGQSFASPTSESHIVGSLIKPIYFRDGDYGGPGHEVASVTITGGTGQSVFYLNKVNTMRYDMYLKAPLDFEAINTYNLTFLIVDNDPVNPLNSTAKMTIRITDVNDSVPTCSSYNIFRGIREDVPVNTNLSAIMPGLNCSIHPPGQLSYFLISPANSPLEVDSNTGEITLMKNLDFDQGDRHLEIVVQVVDIAVKANTSTVTVTVTYQVLDVDDELSVFTQNPFTANISEEAKIHTVALSISTTDGDSSNPLFSRITYGLESQCTQNWFILDSLTGNIIITSALDYDVASVVQCTVYAYSSVNYANRTFANISIYIIDINEFAPNFTQPVFEGKIAENASIGTFVLNAFATDQDQGTNRVFTYRMIYASPFEIDLILGTITLSSGIDYETKTLYYLQVEGVDKGTPVLSAKASVIIHVTPVNEFDPVLRPFTNQRVSERAPLGSLVTSVSATDDDKGDDGQIQYRLQDVNVPFVLERDSGALKVGAGLDRETTASYTLVVIASDMSRTNVKSSSSTMTIYIEDENDNDPMCDPLGPIIVTPNLYSNNDLLGQLRCFDSDPGTNLLYTEIGGDAYDIFLIDAHTGWIRLRTTGIAGVYMYGVSVSDLGSTGRSISVTVEIRVEENLKFHNLPDFIIVSENFNVSDVLFNVTAGGAYDSIDYEIAYGNSAGKFYLHPSSGELRLAAELDLETETNSYALYIKASTSNGQTIYGQLTINIQDYNDNSPTYTNSFYIVGISEDATAGTLLKQITATDKDLQAVNNQIDYSIVSGNAGGLFEYETSSGYLKLVAKLDYDTTPSYTLILKAADRGTPSLVGTTTVFVNVTDVDEHKPVIVQLGGTVFKFLPEDTAIGAPVIKIDASDKDRFSKLTFTIVSGNTDSVFHINQISGVISLVSSLDRENISAYSLVIRVNNTAGQTDETTLQITVTDVNDNSPVFSTGNYVFKTPHGTPAGATIGTLTVTDSDSGVNKDVVLGIASGDPSNRFTFSNQTLKSNSVLNANLNNSYELLVLAVDKGIPTRNKTAYVTVLVEPEFKHPKFIPTRDSISGKETILPGWLNYDTDATFYGAKEQASGDLIYSISGGNLDNLFYVEPYTGMVQLLAPFNFRKTQSYSLLVKAANKYDPNLSDIFTLEVIVIQENRYDPAFLNNLYNWTVQENAVVGTILGRVSATDQDPGQFGNVSYGVEKNGHFVIDPTTGTITVSSPLEYSTAKSHNFYVTATDKAGTSSRESSAVVVINVNDVNNHAPVFSNLSYSVTVSEKFTPGRSFYMVIADDLDSGNFGDVQYFITSGNAGSIFSIGASTGELFLNQHLDYETIRQYVLTIQGRDGGTPSLSGTTTLIINILDENDNPPQFSDMRVELSIRADTPLLTSIYTAHAFDVDFGHNGRLSYQIEADTSPNLFSIQSTTGILKTDAVLVTASGYYVLEVIAVDEGLPTMTGTVTLGINVVPVLNPLPGDFNFFVPENEAVGTLVGTIPKDPSLSATRYIITGGNFANYFGISTNSKGEGQLSTRTVLDREQVNSFQLSIDVQHTGGVKQWSVAVTVVDKNDNAPRFSNSYQQLQMVENLSAGNVIGTLSVTDADSGANSDLDLYISSNYLLGNLYFTVSATGQILVKRPVDYEVFHSITFQVTAQDRGIPSLNDTTTVTIIVTDVNETIVKTSIEAASFKSLEFPDDVRKGDIVGTLSALDVGITLGSGDTLKFIIVDPSSVFAVRASSGAITVNREDMIFQNARYNQWFIITVTSGGVTTSHALMVRLDTFNKAKHLVVVGVSLDLANLVASRASLLTSLKARFQSPKLVKIWKVQQHSQAGRRKLLATQSEALIVVLEDSSADNLTNVDKAKKFLLADQALPNLATSSGAPIAVLASGIPAVDSVTPYILAVTKEENDQSLAPEAIVAIVLSLLIILLLIVTIIAVLYYCLIYRKRKRVIRHVDKKKPGDAHKNRHSRVRERQVHGQKPDQFVYTLNGKTVFLEDSNNEPEQMPNNDEEADIVTSDEEKIELSRNSSFNFTEFLDQSNYDNDGIPGSAPQISAAYVSSSKTFVDEDN